MDHRGGDAPVPKNIYGVTKAAAEDLPGLRTDAAAVVARRVPSYTAAYEPRGWKMFSSIDRVYVNDKAREELGWAPKADFEHLIENLSQGEGWRSPLAQSVGSKGYHQQTFEEGPYPVD